MHPKVRVSVRAGINVRGPTAPGAAALAALATLGACGGSGGAGPGDANPPPDVLVDAPGAIDGRTPADAPADACPFGSWMVQGDQQPFGRVNDMDDNDWGVEISRDGLRVVFSSDRVADFDIYMAQRSSTAVTFDSPVHLPVSTPGQDSDPTMSDDALEIYFVSDVGGGPCIHVSTRPTTAASWSMPRRLDSLCQGPVLVEGPFLSRDAKRLYYDVMQLAGPPVVMMAVRDGRNLDFTDADPVGAPSLRYVALDEDELTLYGESIEDGNAQIWEATRPRIGAPFSAAHPIPELADAFDTGDPSITADGRHLFFSSGHVGPQIGPAEMYMADRGCQ